MEDRAINEVIAMHRQRTKQNWTEVVLSLLPGTTRQINLNPQVVKMNKKHHAARKARGAFIAQPVNSMVYDTLVRLWKRGVVGKDENGRWFKL